MKVLNKIEVKLLKSYILRKQDFPFFLNRDDFINQLSGVYEFILKSDKILSIASYSDKEKDKMNRVILTVYLLLSEANNQELYNISYNCKTFLNEVNKAVGILEDVAMDNLLDKFKSILSPHPKQ
jgi:hypothetical protein